MPAVYEHRNDDFYCRDSRHTGKTLGYISHLHRHIELGFVLGGKTRVSVDSNTYEVNSGDVVIIFPNQTHRFETIERERYILLLINPDLMPELSQEFTTTVPASNLIEGAANDPVLRNLIEKISELYYEKGAYRDTILRGYLLAFFGLLLRRVELRDVQSCDYHVLGLILNYCIKNYASPLSLSVLERELHVSKYYISHVMSQKLHIGFNDYVNSLRISNACRLLRKSKKSITEISELVGFNTLRTFNRAFFKQMGVTPSDYRLSRSPESVPPSVPQ